MAGTPKKQVSEPGTFGRLNMSMGMLKIARKLGIGSSVAQRVLAAD
jgi:hypothetical protein